MMISFYTVCFVNNFCRKRPVFSLRVSQLAVNEDVCNITNLPVSFSFSSHQVLEKKKEKTTERSFQESRVNTSTGKHVVHKIIFASFETEIIFVTLFYKITNFSKTTAIRK